MKKHQFGRTPDRDPAQGAGTVRLSGGRSAAVRFRQTQIAASRVYGVATFYHFFQLKPQGQHACVVCMGTAAM